MSCCSDVSFRALTEEEFCRFGWWSTADYARSLIASGGYEKKAALAEANKEFVGALPDGLQTPGHRLLAAVNREGVSVGILWVEALEEGGAFLEEFVVLPAYRRRGYGLGMLQRLEEHLREAGVGSLSLHVFSGNTAAAALYRKAGFHRGETLSKTGGFYMKKTF